MWERPVPGPEGSDSETCLRFADPEGKCLSCPDYHSRKCSLAMAQAIIDSASTLLAYLDSDFRFMLANKAYVEKCGHTYQEIIGTGHFDLFPDEENEAIFRKVRDSGQATSFKAKPFIFRDQPWRGVIYCDWTLQPVKNSGNHLLGLVLSLSDVTERIRSEQALQESEERYRTVVEDQTEFISRFLPGGVLTFVNEAICRYFGLPREELLGQSFLPLMKPAARERLERLISDLTPADRTVVFEGHRPSPATGETTWQQWTIRALYGEDGKLAEYQAVGRDITPQKLVEKELRRAREEAESKARELERISSLLTAHLENAPLAVVEWDSDFRIIRWSRGAEHMLGWTWEEVRGKTLQDFRLIHDDDREYVMGRMRELTNCAVKRQSMSNRNYRKDGSVIHCEWHNSVQTDSAGWIVSLLSFGLDVTWRVRAEEELRASQEMFRATFEQAAVGIAHVAPDGTFIRVNGKFCDITGYSLEELARLTFIDITHPDDVDKDKTQAQALIDGRQQTYSLDKRYIRKDGSAVWVSLTGSIVRKADGSPSYLIRVIEDITDRKEAEEAIRLAKREAEEANRAKSDFLANMSHEIRTPLNGIMGMTELALTSSADERTRRYLGMASQSARNLLEIINDLLDFAKIEIGRIRLSEQEFNLHEHLRATLQPLEMRATAKGLRIEGIIEPGVPATVTGDAGRLGQILVNLVDNAIKFTEQGVITVRVSPAGERGPDGAKLPVLPVLFEVRDTGIGIPADKMDHIFESFYQLGTSAHVKYGGTGLGLSITRSLVEMMGGDIRVESMPDRGSTFRVTIPFKHGAGAADEETRARLAREQGKTGQPLPAPLGPLDILLAEDNAINQILAVELLKSDGHRVTVADNGRKALEALAHHRFDLVLMDVRMPEMDGLEATRAIRTGNAQGADPAVPIIALTAHALEGDRERFVSAGMDDYLPKPIDPDELQRVLRRVRAKRS